WNLRHRLIWLMAESTLKSTSWPESWYFFMIMSILDTALFATPVPATLGVGFHNVGSGVLRASNEALVKRVERHYGARCGHLPLDAGNVRVLVVQHTTDIRTQID